MLESFTVSIRINTTELQFFFLYDNLLEGLVIIEPFTIFANGREHKADIVFLLVQFLSVFGQVNRAQVDSFSVQIAAFKTNAVICTGGKSIPIWKSVPNRFTSSI